MNNLKLTYRKLRAFALIIDVINLALIFYCTLTYFTRMTNSVLDETEIVSIVIDDVFVEEIIIVISKLIPIFVPLISVTIDGWLEIIGYFFRVPNHVFFLTDIVHRQRMVMDIGSLCIFLF